ncbi:MAG: efflux RND transporter periplasmic adaptor subunit [Pseudomonadota bacterium]|nr:MAG: efflux RND transporter periplasmic adaptor subunit [Pseudomonadota bacterium]
MQQPSLEPAAVRPFRPLALVAAAACLALGLAGCTDSAAEQEAKPDRPVLVTKVHFEDIVPERTFVATIRPRVESDIGFRVGGKVARRLVQVGDKVTPGTPLAELDATDLRLQAEQAEAELHAARTALAQAEAEEKRSTELRRRGWASEAAFDRQKAAAAEARSRLARAERSVELTRNNLSYATLTADTDGVVTATLVEPGQVVAAGQTAIRVARLGEKEAIVAVPETLLGRVRQGEATVTLWSDPDRRYAARLRELSPAADPTTRTYLARFSMPDAGDEVAFGMSATLTVRGGTGEKAARLPLSALFNQGSGPALWVVDRQTGSVALKPVTVARYDAREVLVTGGVEEGDEVVALGVQKLDPAQKVRVVEALAY